MASGMHPVSDVARVGVGQGLGACVVLPMAVCEAPKVATVVVHNDGEVRRQVLQSGNEEVALRD
eukprot:9205975-Lingulodinium_polyedra.AAC.1